MARSVKSLSGADKNAYIARVVRDELGAEHALAEKVVDRLGEEVTRLWVKVEALIDETASSRDPGSPEPAIGHDEFDPFRPNVVVELRRHGREGAMAALSSIQAVDQLKRLAREQQLGIDPALRHPEDVRLAILAAAERRVAGRRAAAS
jgi:hypothetical protein